MTTKVSNPLTIVAIFAGLAEAFATIALIYVPHDIQLIFVYFVMAFPTIIVLVFFGVLIFKHSVLYAPSDYSDERMFFDLLSINSLKSEVLSKLSILSPDVPPLSPKQLESVSNKIDTAFINTIDENLFEKEVQLSEFQAALISNMNRALSRKDKPTLRDKQILKFLRDNGPSTSETLSKSIEISESTIVKYLNDLIAFGKVLRNSKDYTYYLSPKADDESK